MSQAARPSKLIRVAVAAVLGASLPALAQGPAPQPAPTPPAATPTINPPQAPIPPAGAPAAKPEPPASGLKAFKEVVKDAKETQGFLNVYAKDDKTWIE